MQLLSSAAVRRCLIADEGMVIISSDFDQIELRVVAALAGEQSMIDAAKRGESLHKLAATKLFGEGYNPDQYKLAKNINFTWVYGGGPEKMSWQYGIPFRTAVDLSTEYANAFPALVAFKREEQNRVLITALNAVERQTYKALRSRLFQLRNDTMEGKAAQAQIKEQIKRLCYRKIGYVFTPFGRRLIVDADKAYAAVNYKVQSSSRDIMGLSLLRVMRDRILQPKILLPIHDEFLAQAFKKDAERVAQRLARVMSTEFMGVPITATGKVYGKSWGHGYV
jgi:DNA polymerase-1